MDIKIPVSTLNTSQIDVIRECKRRQMRSGGLSLPLGFGKTRTSVCMGLVLSKDPILAVMSKTLIPSWVAEIKKAFGPDFPYEILHRSYLKGEYENWIPKSSTKIVLTTSDVLCDTYKDYDIESRFIRYNVPLGFGPTVVEYVTPTEPCSKQLNGPGRLFGVKWGTLIVDEIQKYTEITTTKCRSIAAICSDFRWGLSGTMFDEPKHSRFLGFMVMLHIDGTPRTLPDMRTYLRTFPGLKTFIIKRDKNPDFIPPEYIEKIVSHNLGADEGLIFTCLKKVFVTLSQWVTQATINNDIVGKRLYSAYKLALITYLRQALICPLIPVTSMFCDMGDFRQRSELSELAMSEFRKVGIEHYLENEDSIMSTRFKEVLKKIETHKTERCIVFSSFRSVTDLLMNLVEKTGRNVITIAASDSIENRGKIIQTFEKSENSVMIIPYDIGAEGLNLQCASVVMLVDLWWNSAKTQQAIGRVFRPGQTAPSIFVYIFVSDTNLEREIIRKNTVKANILSQFQEGSVAIGVPTIDMKTLCKLISLEENTSAISEYRSVGE